MQRFQEKDATLNEPFHDYYEFLFNNTLSLIALTDGERILDANKPFRTFFTEQAEVDIYAPTFRIGEVFAKIDKYGYVYDGYENKRWFELILQNTKEYYRVGIRTKTQFFEFSVTLSPFKFLKNSYIITFNDITKIIAYRNSVEFDLKIAQGSEEETAFRLSQYSRAIDLSNLVIKIAPHGEILYVNEAFCKTLKYERSELLNSNINLFRYEGKSYFYYRSVLDVIHAGNVYNGFVDLMDKGHQLHNFTLTIVPIKTQIGNVIEYLGVLNEITEINQAKLEAVRALEIKNSFFDRMSHELRTPLNAILNFTDQVLESYDDICIDEESRDLARLYVQRAHKNSKILLSLVNSLLEVSKLRSGKEHFVSGCYDIVTLVRETFENCSSLSDRSSVSYELALGIESGVVECDALKLQQILSNLISNALKFTYEGFVRISLYQEEDAYCVVVEDTGIGIAPEKLGTVFEPFEQLGTDGIGTGLGLGIAKEYASAMHISLDVTSTLNEGSSFMLKIKKFNKERPTWII